MRIWVSLCAWVLALVGCAPLPAASPAWHQDHTPALLLQPAGQDWTANRITSRRLAQARRDRHLQAFTAASGWNAAGVALSSMGGSSSDSMTNGPAATFTASQTPAAAVNKVFFLTNGGNLIRCAAGANPTSAGNRTVLALGKTFTRTFVTLSPACSRLYLISDDGTFFIVDSGTMTIKSQTSLGSGLTCQGLAAVLDPQASHADDTSDVLYVPSSDGKIRRYVITASGGTVTATLAATYALGSGSGSVKLKSPPMIYDGTLYVGDQAGNLIQFDTASATTTATYVLGSAPIDAPTALDLDDNGAANALFVTTGASCVWIDLAAGLVHFSLPLFLDDGDTSKPTCDYLLNYDSSSTIKTYYLSLQDGFTMNIASASCATNLFGFSSFKEATDISPADNYVDNVSGHGTAVGFLRFSNADNNIPAGSVIQKIQLLMQANAGMRAPPPQIMASEPYLSGTTTLWTNAAITCANRPAIGAVIGGLIGNYTGSGHGNYSFPGPGNGLTSSYNYWECTGGFASSPTTNYSMAVEANSGGNSSWQRSTAGPAPTNGNSSGVHSMPEFLRGTVTGTNQHPGNNPAIANSEQGPLLQFQVSSATMPTPSIQSMPILDADRKVVYVHYTNCVFILDYSDPVHFSDTDVSQTAGTQTPHTIFRVSHMGDRTQGSSFGSTYLVGTTRTFVGNTVMPALGYDGNELYVVDRYPTAIGASGPTTYTYSLTKIGIGSFAAGAATPARFTISNFQAFTGLRADVEPGSFVTIDLFSGNTNIAGDHLNFGLPGAAGAAGTAFIDAP